VVALDDPVYLEALARVLAWRAEAVTAGLPEPFAASLATVSPAGAPSVRVVLVKEIDPRGFAFFTHRDSAKGRDLAATPRAALALFWAPLGRQVRADGPVVAVSDAESDAYFAARPRLSQVGAWASHQSEPLDDRETLEARVAEIEGRFAGRDVPRPPRWGGYRLVPERLELWEAGQGRLHHRVEIVRDGNRWHRRLLNP
jgi:pyridoxamine 5'-phosphate oxidase